MSLVEQNYQRWLNSPKVSEETKEELRKMSQGQKDDAFFKDVEFGTAGMRGVLGPGTNRWPCSCRASRARSRRYSSTPNGRTCSNSSTKISP